MWFIMAQVQQSYELSERLIRAISNWQDFANVEDDVDELIEAGADVNQVHGTLLPLHCACMVQDTYSVNLLIQKGAQVNKIDGYGRAALHYAAERFLEGTEILLDHGADIDIRDGNEDTALHWAAFKNNFACVKVLLQRGANVNATDYNNDTPISWAAMKGNLESIKTLLEYNAQVDVRNYNGYTALQRTARLIASGINTEKDDACMELLLKAGGQVELRNPQGQLPDLIERDNKLSEMLMVYCKNSRRLQELCRHGIRRYLGNAYLPNVVLKLPLPPALQEYVLLQR